MVTPCWRRPQCAHPRRRCCLFGLFAVDAADIPERELDKAKQVFFIITSRVMIPRERVSEHLAKPKSKVPVPQTMDENEAAKVIPQERLGASRGTHCDEPVPQFMEETADVMLDGSEVVQVFAQELALNRAAEQIVAAFEPQSQEKLVEVIQLFPQERVSDHIGEHFVDVPGPTDSGMNRRS